MSYRRAGGRPLKEVELQITLEAKNAVLRRISKLSKGARISAGSLSFTIRGRDAALVARKARKLAKVVRSAAAASK